MSIIKETYQVQNKILEVDPMLPGGFQRRASQRALEVMAEQVARLLESDSILILVGAVEKARGPAGGLVPLIASRSPRAIPDLSELTALFKDRRFCVREVPAEIRQRLGRPSGSAWAAPIFIDASDTPEPVVGLVILTFERPPLDVSKIEAAAKLLAEVAHLELRQRDLVHLLAVAKLLSARHIEQWEEERAEVAREIHDDLSQNVTFIRLALATVERNLDVGRLERVKSEMAELQRTSVEIKDSVQRLSGYFRPSMLEVLGPAPAIRQEVQLHRGATGMTVDCELEELVPPVPVSLAIFRILQECLARVARHASVSKVQVGLARQGETVVFSVSDNGRDFYKDAPVWSLGISAMIERAQIAGGAIQIRTTPLTGTQVLAEFPGSGGTTADGG